MMAGKYTSVPKYLNLAGPRATTRANLYRMHAYITSLQCAKPCMYPWIEFVLGKPLSTTSYHFMTLFPKTNSRGRIGPPPSQTDHLFLSASLEGDISPF